MLVVETAMEELESCINQTHLIPKLMQFVLNNKKKNL